MDPLTQEKPPFVGVRHCQFNVSGPTPVGRRTALMMTRMMMMMMMVMLLMMMMGPLRKHNLLWSVQALAGARGSSVLPVRGTDF